MRGLGTLSPKWTVTIKSLQLDFKELTIFLTKDLTIFLASEKEAKKDWRSQRGWKIPRKPDPSTYGRTNVHMNS